METQEFEQKLKENHEKSYAWALALCFYDHALAEDILQESYLKAFKAVGKFREDSSLKTWLYRIIQNTARDYLRVNKRRQELTADFLDDQKKFKSDSKEKKVRAQGDRKAMSFQLEKLSKREREVIELVYFQELSTDETAEIIGISRSSVNTYLKRAKERMHGNISHDFRQTDCPSFEKTITHLVDR